LNQAMFEQTFKNIDNVLRTEAGCQNELDYVEQTSWVIFLKYLDDLEADREAAAELSGQSYKPILTAEYRWSRWAAPKTKSGEIDHNKALTGDDLIEFVSKKLFPYLARFHTTADHPDTIEYKIGEIFREIRNKVHSGYSLRDILNRVDELRFRSQAERHEMSALYEDKIKNMGNAGRNGGEYYTPRPLIRAIVKVVAPRIGERIYDPAVGSAGFLCEAYEYLKASRRLTVKDAETLQKRTFFGKEKKSLAYVIGTMNMILHGIEAPDIRHTNTLIENITDIQEKDRYDVILANPPFGGSELKQLQQNFPIKSSETAYLFLQHAIKSLKAGGRAGIVIKNTFLSNNDNASVSIRKLLLESCDLHTILDCPSGTFLGAGVKTIVLFFTKGAKTRKIWYYKLEPGRNMGKTNPLNDDDLKEFISLQVKKPETPKSWCVTAADVRPDTYDLTANNPNEPEAAAYRNPEEILDEIAALDTESAEMLSSLRALL
jgi:type I restriction enzyme M protein